MPVVAMTAYVMDAEKEKCRAAGMNDYLAKPLDEVELKKILQKYLAAYIKPVAQNVTNNSNAFLLQLAGGDEQMAEIILNQVKQEIPGEVARLKKIVAAKNVSDLPAVCHHLISSISPLGNNSSVMKRIAAIQKAIAAKETEPEILKNTKALIEDLENTLNNFK